VLHTNTPGFARDSWTQWSIVARSAADPTKTGSVFVIVTTVPTTIAVTLSNATVEIPRCEGFRRNQSLLRDGQDCVQPRGAFQRRCERAGCRVSLILQNERLPLVWQRKDDVEVDNFLLPGVDPPTARPELDTCCNDDCDSCCMRWSDHRHIADKRRHGGQVPPCGPASTYPPKLARP
jgi:hypothetical protein